MQGGSKQQKWSKGDANVNTQYLRARRALGTSSKNTERAVGKRVRRLGKKDAEAQLRGEAIGESIQQLSELLGIRPPMLQRPKLRKPGILKPRPGTLGGSAVRTAMKYNRGMRPGAARPAATAAPLAKP